MQINPWAVLVSAVAAFVIGALWYSPLLFGNRYLALRGLDPSASANKTIPPAEIIGEFVRWLVLAFILAHFMRRLGTSDLLSAIEFGAWSWVAIYTALAGSVIHEGTPWRLYAIHAGDGLVKILAISAILGLWQAR
jgi:hypothetical protein